MQERVPLHDRVPDDLVDFEAIFDNDDGDHDLGQNEEQDIVGDPELENEVAPALVLLDYDGAHVHHEGRSFTVHVSGERDQGKRQGEKVELEEFPLDEFLPPGLLRLAALQRVLHLLLRL